ncbi:subclass B1 metallo-beta-lactamase [Rheinheimera sp.]|uniref:subclass B1 metallo-beta-lactamase n=1 Tax=Rheinheimera sp. TaxID=1869214 RepID=UPI00307D5303
MKLFSFILSFLLWLSAVLPVQAEPKALQLSPDLEVIQLSPDLWVHRSWYSFPNGVRFYSNGVLARYQGKIWIIDTAWGNESTEKLLDWVQTELKLPVHSVVATHSHADKTGGSALLYQRQIPFFSSAQTRLLSIKENIPLPQSLGRFDVGQKISHGPFELYYPGPGHTKDNLVAYLPQAQVLVGGCAIKAPRFPGLGYIAEADLAHWPKALQAMRQQYSQATVVVPGHGEIGDMRLIDYSLNLFKVKF